jgi:hypothetical protein
MNMNTQNAFEPSGQHSSVFNGQPLTNEKEAQSSMPTESQWRRVLGVVLIEGEMRYVVEGDH